MRGLAVEGAGSGVFASINSVGRAGNVSIAAGFWWIVLREREGLLGDMAIHLVLLSERTAWCPRRADGGQPDNRTPAPVLTYL